MKYIKQYEELNLDEPEIGDYVVALDNDEDNTELNYFTSNNVGQISGIEYVEEPRSRQIYDEPKMVPMYVIRFDNITDDIKRFFNWHITDTNIKTDRRGFYISEILYHSKNKEAVITYIKASKYYL